jgi:hypothetical protein
MSPIPSHARPITWLVLVSACAILLWRLWILGLSCAFDPAASVDVLMDDAYYYLQIAYNLGHVGRSTFDGITDSNGYQPAWMLLIAAIEVPLRLDKKGLFIALQLLIFMTIALPLLFCMRRYRDSFYLGLCAGLTVSYAWFPAIYVGGLETVLVAPAFVAIAHVARSGFYANARKLAWLVAATVWIRLDAVSLVVAFALPFAHAAYRRAGLRAGVVELAKFAAPAGLFLAAYALPNWLWFGSPVPLSGVAKTIGAPPFSNWGILYNYVLQTLLLLPIALAVLAVEGWVGKFRGGRFVYVGCALLAVSVAVQYFYYAAFSGWIPWPWYFYAYALMAALLMTRVVMLAMELEQPEFVRVRAVLASFVAVAALAAPAFIYVLLTRQLWQNQYGAPENDGSFNRRNVADALAFAQDPAPKVVAIGDRAAGLGYWSPERVKVFALEGLVASKAYLDARRKDTGEDWVREHVQPDTLVVDRETLEPVRLDGVERYVVIEPIQGRVVLDHLLVYCFAKDAVLHVKRERDDQLVVLPAPATRVTFDFRRAEVCKGAFADYAREQIVSSDSLRRTAVGVEYAGFMVGPFNAALERFDRGLARNMRTFLRELKGQP